MPLLAPKGPADVAQITIAADSPLGKELLELSSLLATRQQLPSGIQVKHVVPSNVDERIARLVEHLKKMGIPADRMVADVEAGARARAAAANGSGDPILKAGLSLLGAAAGIAGTPEAGKALAEKLVKELSK